MIDGIIFDIDGTLWDAVEQIAISWNRALREIAHSKHVLTQEAIMRQLGKPVEKIMEGLFPGEPKEERDRLETILTEYENTWVETAPCHVYPGMPETVRALAERFPLYIVSNCQSGYIEAFLKNTGLGACFRDHACPGDTGVAKAGNIRIIMERNGLSHAVYVGDTAGDEQACIEAGVPMIYAAYGFGEVEHEHISIHSFVELLNIDYGNL